MNDWQLLEEYVERGSEEAFRTLVDRHLNLVHAVALRQTGDATLAEEIAQAVFILLARKARSFRNSVILPGWLFRTTRFVAARARRAEHRRQRREQEAVAVQPQLVAPSTASSQMIPLLDEALAGLPKGDREAVLLRYLRDQSHREVGAALGLNEATVRKRISRALERLRQFFTRRGITLSAAALSAALAEQIAPAAPTGLAARIAAQSLGSAAQGAVLPALVRETLNAWHWARLQLAGSIAAVGVGIAVLVGHLPGLLTPAAASAPDSPATARQAESPAVRDEIRLPQAPAPVSPNPEREILELQVIARDTGEPVAQAVLAINTVDHGKWEFRQDLATDERGWCEVRYPKNAGRLDVGVLSPGWAARFVTWIVAKDGEFPAAYVLKVDRVTNSVGGWLFDPENKPVGGAEIVVEFASLGDAANREMPRERPGCPGEGVVARSGPDGYWTCAVFARQNHGGFRLAARHPAFPKTDIASDDALRPAAPETLQKLWAGALVTYMDAGATLSGIVTDEDGRPIAAALVAHDPESSASLTTRTDPDGRFQFSKLKPGSFDFSISAPGYAPQYRKLDLVDSSNAVELRLKPGGVLILHAVDELSRDVAGVEMILEQWGEVRHKLKWSSKTGPDGRIQWDSAPLDATLGLCARGSDWCYTRHIQVTADGKEHLVNMRRALEITGGVTNAETGQPVFECKAFPGYGTGRFAWERLDTRQCYDGTYSVRFDENRLPWRVRIEADGFEPFVSEAIPPDFSGPLNVLLKPLDSSSQIRGVVVSPDGQPAAGAEVALLTLEYNVILGKGGFLNLGPSRLRLRTGPRGEFLFQFDPDAHSLVAVSRDGFARLRLRESGRPMIVQLQPWSRIEGTIDPALRSQPIDRVEMMDRFPFTSVGHVEVDRNAFHPQPDADGHFVIEFVPPGEWFALAINPGIGIPFHHVTPFRARPGEALRVRLADEGVRVRGRFVAPPDRKVDWIKDRTWARIESPAAREPSPPPNLSERETQFWLVGFCDSEAGQRLLQRRSGARLNVSGDGSFQTIEAVPPGEYRLHFAFGGIWGERKLTVPPQTSPLAELDIGEVPVGVPDR